MSFGQTDRTNHHPASRFHGDHSYLGTAPRRYTSSMFGANSSVDMSLYTPDILSASAASESAAIPPIPPLPRPAAYPWDSPSARPCATDDEDLTYRGVRQMLNRLIGAQRQQQEDNDSLRIELERLTRWTTQLAAAHNETAGLALRMERLVAEQDMVIARLVAFIRTGVWWAL